MGLKSWLEERNKPVPQPSPLNGDAMAAAVLNPTIPDQVDFAFWVGLRYGGQLLFTWPKAWIWALTTRYPEPVPDAELLFILLRTACARGVTPQLDPADEQAFGPLLNDPTAKYWKADFSGFEGLELRPGCYAAPTVTLIEVPAQGEPRIKAVKINDLVVEPTHGHAWELTKYFVMQGLSQHMVTCHHIPVHFPNDAINAVTHSHLSKNHPLRVLLTQHFRFSLALSNSALHSQASVLYNHQVFPYTPYAFTGKSVRELAVTGHGGVEGNSAYPRFTFSSVAHHEVVGDYGEFLKLYHGVIRKWVGSVVNEIEAGDPEVKAWANEIGKWVRGFPNSTDISNREFLADVVAYILLNITVMHAAEHYDYAVISPAKMPHRLRIPPPTSTEIPAFDHRKLATKLDAFRHWMAWNLFYREVTVTKFVDIRYGFQSPALQAAEEEYKRELRALDANMPVRKIIPLENISASIQF